jgi:Kdo2-lipid IVA lauroyltransferase/acyltransferase
MPRLSHIFEYAVTRSAEFAARLLPRPLALQAGAFVGMILYHAGIYRRIVHLNFVHVGLWSASEEARITRELYANTGKYVVEFLRYSSKLPPYRFDQMDLLTKLQARGKGIIVFLAHVGNWEIFVPIFGPQFPDLTVVTNPVHNPLVWNWIWKNRTALGTKFVMREQALRKMISALRTNKTVALLLDQYAGVQGTPSIFLGKPALTYRTVAGILHKLDPAILGTYAILEKDGSYSIYLEEGRDLGISRDDEDAFISAYQTDHNEMMSRWIRKYPEHYFGWFHKRFKDTVDYGK